MIVLSVNGKRRELDVDPDMPLFWALRDHLALTGTKYGCGMSLCGACAVHPDGEPVRACVTRCPPLRANRSSRSRVSARTPSGARFRPRGKSSTSCSGGWQCSDRGERMCSLSLRLKA